MERTKEMEEWAPEALNLLKKNGYIKEQRIGGNWKVILGFLLGILFTSVIYYGIYTDAFKDDVSQEVKLDPNITVNEDIDVHNSYDFETPTENKYYHNITIINNINCS